jgi:hypothetical protein
VAEGDVGMGLDADYDLKQRHRRAQGKNRPNNGLFAFEGGFVYNIGHLSAPAGSGRFYVEPDHPGRWREYTQWVSLLPDRDNKGG